MKCKEAIKAVMTDANTTQARLADALGYSSGQSAIAQRLRGDIQISTLSSMMEAMGYEVVLQKKKTGRRPDGQYVITNEEE